MAAIANATGLDVPQDGLITPRTQKVTSALIA